MKSNFARADTIVAYHGSQRWSGPPEIRPAKSMRDVEHGAGFYLTTGVETAARYAKGGGAVLRFELQGPLRLLEDARIDVADMVDFVRAAPRMRHKKEVLRDLEVARARSGRDDLFAPTLGNLLHFHGVAHGEVGVALSRFYVDHGIDADIVENKGLDGTETWIVLFNLARILRYDRVSGARR